MQPTTLRTKRTIRQWIGIGIIVLIVGTVAGMGIFFWYNATHLFVTNVRPESNGTATGATDVVLWFNKPISADTAKNLSISPKVSGKTTVSGNSVTFSPDNILPDSSYSVMISQAISQDKNYKSGKIKLSFKIGYVPYDQQPEEVQKRGLKFTDDRAPVLGYFGADDLTNQGVTSAQLINIEAFLKSVHDTIPPLSDDAVNIYNVEALPFDSNATNQKQTYTFDVQINDPTYKAVLDCFILGDSQVRLYDAGGNLVKDSGVMKSNNQTDDSDLVN